VLECKKCGSRTVNKWPWWKRAKCMVFPNYQNIYQYLNYFNSMIDRPQVLIAIQKAIKNKKLKKNSIIQI